MEKDVVIIGSGPAGLTAAIYSARANLDTLIVAGIEHGGQLMGTTLVENFPGFSEGIMGPKLMMEMEKQAQNQGAEMLFEIATDVDLHGDMKVVKTSNTEIKAKVVIIAVGSSPRRLDIPGETKYWGKGVSTCATCDGAFYKEKEVAVIGGGDTAMEEATFLTKFASKVYVIHRRDELRASKAMQDRAIANEKIEFIWNTEVTEVLGNDSHVEKLLLSNSTDGTQSELEVAAMFLAIGHIPNSGFLTDKVKMDDHGYVNVTDHTQTSVPGVFVCGDVHDQHYEQAITAAGMGCKAAMDADRWLASRS